MTSSINCTIIYTKVFFKVTFFQLQSAFVHKSSVTFLHDFVL